MGPNHLIEISTALVITLSRPAIPTGIDESQHFEMLELISWPRLVPHFTARWSGAPLVTVSDR